MTPRPSTNNLEAQDSERVSESAQAELASEMAGDDEAIMRDTSPPTQNDTHDSGNTVVDTLVSVSTNDHAPPGRLLEVLVHAASVSSPEQDTTTAQGENRPMTHSRL